MADFEVTGKQQFVGLAKALNAQGSAGKGLKRELMAEIKTAAKPMENEVRAHLPAYLPNRYAAILAASLVVRPSQSTRGSGAGLKLTGYAKGKGRRRQVNAVEGGVLRHPAWGNRKAWVAQKVKPGFWSEPMERSRDKPATAIRRAIQNAIRKLN
jgi:hypothetical protein